MQPGWRRLELERHHSPVGRPWRPVCGLARAWSLAWLAHMLPAIHSPLIVLAAALHTRNLRQKRARRRARSAADAVSGHTSRRPSCHVAAATRTTLATPATTSAGA